MKNKLSILLLSTFLAACNQNNQTPPATQQNETAIKAETTKAAAQDQNITPPKPKVEILVNNPTPIPQGYKIDTSHLKKPLLVDLNGDGKLDAFRVLKNPNKNGKKYLFEFRIADSDKVYWYENDDEGYDLNDFEVFDIAKKNEKFVDMAKLETGDITPYEDAPEKARIILKTDGITVGLPESCGTSLFFLENNKIRRAFLD